MIVAYDVKNVILFFVVFFFSDLDLTFTTTLLCPWTRNTVDVPIKEGGRSLIVTDQNKVRVCGCVGVGVQACLPPNIDSIQDEYIQCLSEFKVDASVRDETDSFLSGFWKASVTSITTQYLILQCDMCTCMYHWIKCEQRGQY